MRTLRITGWWVSITLALCFSTTAARSDIITLIPSADSTISEKSLDISLGTGITLDSGTTGPNEGLKKNRALVKFDLSSGIPSNAIVTSAALTLTLVTSPTPDSLWFSLHRVFQDWSESAVTWTNRSSPPAPWSVPGGAAPDDYSSSVSQSNLIVSTMLPTNFTFASNDAMVADVQDWVRNPATNFGWILLCEMEDLEKSVRKFASRERTTTNQRPVLEIEFYLQPQPLVLTSPMVTIGQFQAQFNADSNQSYTVLYSTDLNTTNWAVLTNISPLSAPATILIMDPILTNSARFYRLSVP